MPSRTKRDCSAAAPALPRRPPAAMPAPAMPAAAPTAADTPAPLDAALVLRACRALLTHVHAHAAKTKANALPMGDEDDEILLTFGLSQFPEAALKTFKGRALKLPNPYRSQHTDICLLVKDKEEAKRWLGDDYKNVVQKIISLQQLRTQYKTFESRRELAARFEVFIADDRIVCMLPKTLGKAFYASSKRPLPMRFASRDKLVSNFSSRVREVLHSSFFYLSGTCCSVKIGSTKLTAEQLSENIKAVVSQAIKYVPQHWNGVQSIFVKSTKSAALPIFERSIGAELPELVQKVSENTSPRGLKRPAEEEKAARVVASEKKKPKKVAKVEAAGETKEAASPAAEVLKKVADLSSKVVRATKRR